MSSVSIWWKDRKVKAVLTLHVGFEEDGSPKSEDREVVFTVDAPTATDAHKLRRCYFAMQLYQSQMQGVLQAFSSRTMGIYHRFQHEAEMVTRRAVAAAQDSLFDKSEEAQAQAVDSEAGALERLGKIDFLSFSPADEYQRIEEHAEKNEIIMRDAVNLIVCYVKEVRNKVDGGIGHEVLFNGEPWSKMTHEDRVEAAMRLSGQFIQPLMDIIARGAEAEILGK